jgi:DNA invertase Pin-like site-specific DNA recombinase
LFPVSIDGGVPSIAQNIDTDESNPMSRFLLHILAAFGELEREMIRERVVSGIRTAKANGKALGPAAPGISSG